MESADLAQVELLLTHLDLHVYVVALIKSLISLVSHVLPYHHTLVLIMTFLISSAYQDIIEPTQHA